MKLPLPSTILYVCILTFIVTDVSLTTASHGSITLLGGTYVETFDTLPPNTSWSTTAGAFGVNSAAITTDGTADSAVGTPMAPSGTVTAALVSTQLPAAAISGTVAIQTQTRYHGAGFISTAATGDAATLTMLTLTNGTGSVITSMGISYDLGIQNGNVVTPEEIPGHRVYWSLTGLVNSWNPIGDFGFQGTAGGAATQVKTESMTAFFTGWAPGANAYILWLDDNGTTNPDGLYFMDNVSLTPIPEPTVGLLGIGAFGTLGLRRRRRG